jgi:hypothetical protein
VWQLAILESPRKDRLRRISKEESKSLPNKLSLLKAVEVPCHKELLKSITLEKTQILKFMVLVSNKYGKLSQAINYTNLDMFNILWAGLWTQKLMLVHSCTIWLQITFTLDLLSGLIMPILTSVLMNNSRDSKPILKFVNSLKEASVSHTVPEP